MVENLPSSAEDLGLISGQGTKIPHAAGGLRPHVANTKHTHSGARRLQLERSLHATAKSLSTR